MARKPELLIIIVAIAIFSYAHPVLAEADQTEAYALPCRSDAGGKIKTCKVNGKWVMMNYGYPVTEKKRPKLKKKTRPKPAPPLKAPSPKKAPKKRILPPKTPFPRKDPTEPIQKPKAPLPQNVRTQSAQPPKTLASKRTRTKPSKLPQKQDSVPQCNQNVDDEMFVQETLDTFLSTDGTGDLPHQLESWCYSKKKNELLVIIKKTDASRFEADALAESIAQDMITATRTMKASHIPISAFQEHIDAKGITVVVTRGQE